MENLNAKAIEYFKKNYFNMDLDSSNNSLKEDIYCAIRELRRNHPSEDLSEAIDILIWLEENTNLLSECFDESHYSFTDIFENFNNQEIADKILNQMNLSCAKENEAEKAVIELLEHFSIVHEPLLSVDEVIQEIKNREKH